MLSFRGIPFPGSSWCSHRTFPQVISEQEGPAQQSCCCPCYAGYWLLAVHRTCKSVLSPSAPIKKRYRLVMTTFVRVSSEAKIEIEAPWLEHYLLGFIWIEWVLGFEHVDDLRPMSHRARADEPPWCSLFLHGQDVGSHHIVNVHKPHCCVRVLSP